MQTLPPCDALTAEAVEPEAPSIGGTRPEASTAGDPSHMEANEASGTSPPTGELIQRIMEQVRRFVVLSDDQQLALALWVLHTHAIEAFENTPYLSVRSAEKQSGKTRLLEVLVELVARSEHWASRPTAATVFRIMADDQPPTLLLDEIDSIWSDTGRNEEHEDLRGALNAGNRRGAVVPRCETVGRKIKIQRFPVFCAKAFAGIGVPPDTIADRSIPIVLKKRTASETVERFRMRDVEVALPLRQLHMLGTGWSGEHVEELRAAWPELPEDLSDREQDSVEPLIAIADLAGGDWPQRAREALVRVIQGGRAGTTTTIKARALEDCRRVFRNSDDPEQMTTQGLLAGLRGLEDAPWSEHQHGRPLSAERLAFYLNGYGIAPHVLRFEDGKRKRGYRRSTFEDAWRRYLDPAAGEPDPDDDDRPGLT